MGFNKLMKRLRGFNGQSIAGRMEGRSNGFGFAAGGDRCPRQSVSCSRYPVLHRTRASSVL